MTPAKHSQNWLPGIFNDFFGNEWIAKSKEYEVEIAAPGLTKDDFSVRIDDNDHLIITVENKKENEEKDKKGKFLRREFSYSQFRQTLVLPENINKDGIEAKQENGILKQQNLSDKTIKNKPFFGNEKFRRTVCFFYHFQKF